MLALDSTTTTTTTTTTTLPPTTTTTTTTTPPSSTTAAAAAAAASYALSADGTLQLRRDDQPSTTMELADGSAVRVRALPVCGRDHCLALGLAGEVLSWATGRNGHRLGQLGRTDAEKALFAPRQVELPDGAKAASVAAGELHSAVIDERRRLWVFGSDRWLQLGQNVLWQRGAVWQRRPVRVGGALADEAVVDVACGGDHTLALDERGQVWAWGTGQHGQLFGASERPFTAPPTVSRALTGGSGAAAVAATASCSCARRRAGGVACSGRCSERETQLLRCRMGLEALQ